MAVAMTASVTREASVPVRRAMASMARCAAGELNRACQYRWPRLARRAGGRAERLRRDVRELSFPVPHRAAAELPELRRLLAAGDVENVRLPRFARPPASCASRSSRNSRCAPPSATRWDSAQTRYRQAPRCLITAIRSGQSRWKSNRVERPGFHEIGGVPRPRRPGRRHPGPSGCPGRSAPARPPPGRRPAPSVAQPHPQGGMPAHQAAQAGRRILDRAALGQVEHSAHAELAAALLHILQDRLLAPGQRLGAGRAPLNWTTIRSWLAG